MLGRIICEKVDVNPWELVNLANKHPRVNILNPGIGVGGHCIAVDPWFLVSEFKDESNLISTVRETNLNKTKWCLDKIFSNIQQFINVNNKQPKIACMGLAYKPDVDDLRESPAFYIANNIYNKYEDNTLIIEPNISEHQLFELSSINDALERADIIIWLVSHKEFKSLKIRENIIQLDFIGMNSIYN